MRNRERRPWPIGALVTELASDEDPITLRMVIGYRPDGRVLTVYVSPAPWLLPGQRLGVHADDPSLLRPARAPRVA